MLPRLLDLLRNTSRSALSLPLAAPVSCSRSLIRSLSLVVATMLLAACSDVVAPPQRTIDRVAAARVMPAVTDARLRIAAGIESSAIRDRVVYDLGELEVALSNGDANAAQFHVRVVGSVLADYKAQPASVRDRADVLGILLAMNVVTQVLGNEPLSSIM